VPGFFGPTKEFDDFILKVMSPVMEAAGFRRNKRMFRLIDNGSSVVVRADLFTPGPNVSFHIDWAAIPAFFREFVQDGRRSWRPTLDGGLIRTRLTAPMALRALHFASQLWGYHDPAMPNPGGLPSDGIQIDDFAPAFQAHLVDVAIPKWKRSTTTDYLRSAYDNDEDLAYGSSARYGGPFWMRAILGAHEGDPSDATAAIDRMAELNPDSSLIPWLRERLDERKP
jgi:hypothetical protein